jgi:A/G-specific adenine glycosylase
MDFGSEIIRWYNEHKRHLPWRDTRNPYYIWLSEIILQQTRVDQGLAYYQRFVKKYPSVKKLASASEDDVLKLWQGLGYYSRARNLHQTAKEIVIKYNSVFPSDYRQIRLFKGIGEYTAGAILSFAFNKKFPVVDGNVFRLLSRYFGISTPIDSTKGKKEFYKLAEELMEEHSPSLFNQAIMEFGACQCKPKNPDCSVCPLNLNCIAFTKKKINRFPVKSKKMKTRSRYFNYLVISGDDKLMLKKRNENDIWKNLYDFPSIETSKRYSEKKIMGSEEWKTLFGKIKITQVSVSREYRHLLSHQTIHAKFYEVSLSSQKMMAKRNKFILVSKKELKKIAVPKLIENYLEKKIK